MQRLVVAAARRLLIRLVELPLQVSKPALEVEVPGAEAVELAEDEGLAVGVEGD
jgi:hypothetical protein